MAIDPVEEPGQVGSGVFPVERPGGLVVAVDEGEQGGSELAGRRRPGWWPLLWSTIILTMTILPLNDVKTRFSAIADEVAATHDRVIVTRNGRPHVMVIAVDDFESLQMTRELLAEPDAVQDIMVSDREIASGEYHTLDELRAALEERQRQEDAGA